MYIVGAHARGTDCQLATVCSVHCAARHHYDGLRLWQHLVVCGAAGLFTGAACALSGVHNPSLATLLSDAACVVMYVSAVGFRIDTNSPVLFVFGNQPAECGLAENTIGTRRYLVGFRFAPG